MADTSSIWNAVGTAAQPLLSSIGAPISANESAGGYSTAANTVGGAVNTSGAALSPYVTGGQSANKQLQSLFGMNGAPASADAIAAFENTPGFKFQEQQGDQAIQRGANASGNGFSSTTLGALANYNSGLAASTYQNYVNNLFGLNASGENAAVARGSQAITGATAQGGFQVGRANAVASGIQGAFNGVGSAAGPAITAIGKLFGSNGSGGGGSSSPGAPIGTTYDPSTGQYSDGFTPGTFGSPDQSPYVSYDPSTGASPVGNTPDISAGNPDWLNFNP